jgi:N-acetylneuraminic acid mutarotase
MLRTVGRVVLGLVVLAALAVIAVGTVTRLTNPEPREVAAWEALAGLPQARGEGAAAVVDGRLAVIGGLAGAGRTSDAVTFYDPDRDEWSVGPPLPEARHHLGAATLDGVLYVAGGATSARDWAPTTDVWALEPGARQWRAVEPLPDGRWGHRLLALDGRLYAVGGEGGGEVLIFEPGAGWTTGAAAPVARDHVNAAVVDDEIWLMGGRDGELAGLTDRIDVYDPAGDEWRSGPALPAPTSAAAVGVVDDTLVVVGGEDPATTGGGVVDRHWRLPLDAHSWEQAPPPPLTVHGAGYGVLDGHLVVAGGASRQGLWSLLSWSDEVQVLRDPHADPEQSRAE